MFISAARKAFTPVAVTERIALTVSAPRHKDQLTIARAGGFTAPPTVDVLHREADIGDGLSESWLAPEAEAGVAPELFTAGEAVVVREADHVIAQARDFGPDQNYRPVLKDSASYTSTRRGSLNSALYAFGCDENVP